MKRCFLLLVSVLFFATAKAQSWDSYPSYETYVEYMQQTAQKHKDICRLDTIGTSVEGRLLLCMKISNDLNGKNNKPKFFYSAAMHGNELTGAIMLLRLIDTLVTNSNFTATNSAFPDVYICPYANPDGTWHGGNSTISGAMRYNANYVDLNRNYPDIRTGKNSDGENRQAETQAFMTYQEKEKFNMSCNLHTGSEVFNYPWDSYRSSKNKHADDEWFKQLGKDFVSSLNDDKGTYFKDVNNSGIVEGGDWYVIYGSRQDWSTYFAHCREVTLELSMDYTPKANTLDDYWYKLKNSLFTFFDYCYYGFEGVVTDSITGKPLNNVMITIDNYDKDSSQVITNQNGYYIRPILSGSYSVTFSLDGYNFKTLNINTANNLTDYSVKLSPINTSLYESEEITAEIYPLPTENQITISTNQQLNYRIIDLNGKIIKKGTVNTFKKVLNTDNWQSGTYFITLSNDKGQTITRKLIKK